MSPRAKRVSPWTPPEGCLDPAYCLACGICEAPRLLSQPACGAPTTGATLDQVIREELGKMVEATPADVAQIADSAPLREVAGFKPAVGFRCSFCPQVFPSRGELIDHDLAVHLDGNVALADARLRSKTPRLAEEKKGRA